MRDPKAKAPTAGPDADGDARSDGLLDFIRARLDQDKAEDIVTIDLRGKSAIADHMVVASGRSTRQVSALTEKLADELKSKKGVLARIEGKDAGDWVLVDAGDVIVHLFRPEVREFYQLEKMWLTAPETGFARAAGSA
ncbi:MAG: ribosome silencing factor [Pseudomonadota bacterium]